MKVRLAEQEPASRSVGVDAFAARAMARVPVASEEHHHEMITSRSGLGALWGGGAIISISKLLESQKQSVLTERTFARWCRQNVVAQRSDVRRMGAHMEGGRVFFLREGVWDVGCRIALAQRDVISLRAR